MTHIPEDDEHFSTVVLVDVYKVPAAYSSPGKEYKATTCWREGDAYRQVHGISTVCGWGSTAIDAAANAMTAQLLIERSKDQDDAIVRYAEWIHNNRFKTNDLTGYARMVGDRICKRLEKYAKEVTKDGLVEEAKDARMFIEFIRDEEWWRES